MNELGTVRPGSTIYFPFATYATTGGSITMTGLAVTDIEVYKDGGTTQRASDNGYALLDTDGIDFDGVTGAHGFSIDLADNSTAGFWAAGSKYFVFVSTITVDSQTVTFLAGTFQIGYPSALLNTTIATLASQTSFTLTAGPAEDDALNGMWCVIHDVASAVQLGYALISDYTGSTKTVTLAAGTTFTAAATDNIAIMGPVPLQPTVMGRTLDVSTGGEAGVDWANVGSPTTTVGLSGTTVKTATDVETDTADIQARLPAALTAGGNIKADALALSGDTTAADNAEAFFDGTGYAGTGNVIPTVTTLTGHTAQTGDAYARLGAPAGASVSADVAAVKVDTAAILIDTAEIGAAGAGLTTLATAASIAALNNISAAQVATEIADALATDTYAESAAVPAATAALATKISWLTTLARNKITQTATAQVVRNDADNATIATSTLSDDGTTLVRGEFA